MTPRLERIDAEFVEAVARRVADLIGEAAPARLPELIDAEEVARILGVRVDYVWALCREGAIPHLCFGRVKRFRRSAIKRWLEERERGGGTSSLDRDRVHA